MVVSYEEAQKVLSETALLQSLNRLEHADNTSILESVGRVSSRDVKSPASTPPFDTSAMDGFALSSDLAAHASSENPMVFCIKGVLAAGDAPITVTADAADGALVCIEIMTGAQFPKSSPGQSFDACVKIEDTSFVPGPREDHRYIQITRPVRKDQNRRHAGTDFRIGQLVIRKDQIVEPSHVMALASVGIGRLDVRPKIRIGVLCTGSELLPYDAERAQPNLIRNSNGPYILSALSAYGAIVDNLGTVRDDPSELAEALVAHLSRVTYDVLITTGAVSVGKFDMVPDSLRRLGASVKFHKVAMRPGAPILFATWSARCGSGNGELYGGLHASGSGNPRQRDSTAIFGLPGNPMATALGVRFFVSPYLRSLEGQPVGTTIYASATDILGNERLPSVKTAKANGHAPGVEFVCHGQALLSKAKDLDVFRHGYVTHTQRGAQVALLSDQGASKVRPWLEGNCWVHIPKGVVSVEEGEMLRCFMHRLS